MFSMASMTDVIFLLLIFFMVTSTFVFPSALEVNLPQSSQTTTLKPSTRIYIDSLQNLYYTVTDSVKESDPIPFKADQLPSVLAQVKSSNDADHQFVALMAAENVPYGKIVEVLDAGSKAGLKIVLATRPTNGVQPAADGSATTQPGVDNPAQPAPQPQQP